MDLYLKQHPDIFMPEHKEPQFFGKDLLSPTFVRKRDDYLALFAEAEGEKRVGETSVWSLYSERAAKEIKEFEANARIVIILRNPLEMVRSLHSQYLYVGNEDIETLEEALKAEGERKKGLRIPKTATFVQGLFYRETARYFRQVQRYLEVFGEDNVHVIVFDDFKADTGSVYEDTLRFLDVGSNFRPDFQLVNPNKRVRSKILRDFSRHPPQRARRLVRAFLPATVRHTLVRILTKHNTRYEPAQPLESETLKQLRTEFRTEVEQLSELLGRDLGHWVNS